MLKPPLRIYSAIIALFMSVLLPTAASTAEAGTLVERISFSERADGRGMAVCFHASDHVTAYREPVLTPDNQVEIIIFNAALDRRFIREAPLRPVASYEVTPVRDHLRIRFTIERGYPVRVSARRDRRTEDLWLEFDFQAGLAQMQPMPSIRRAAEAAPSEPVTEVDGAQRWRLETIVIDAGHGGRDHGAEAHGVREKDVALAVARKLGRAVEQRLGLRVIYTRTDDRFIGLRERGRIANAAGGKLFISLHVNAAHSPIATGTETYFLGTHKTEAARDVMERENAVVQLENDPELYSSMTDEALILQALTQSAFMQKSEELASLVEAGFDRAGHRSRGVKQAGFYVLWNAAMPSILVEMGFITNRREAAALSTDYGQDLVADAILRAIETYKLRYERDLRVVAP